MKCNSINNGSVKDSVLKIKLFFSHIERNEQCKHVHRQLKIIIFARSANKKRSHFKHDLFNIKLKRSL